MSSRLAAWQSALRYRLVSRLVHQPKLLRVVASALRRWPQFNRAAPIATRRTAVLSVLHRQASFSNAAQAPNLVAGEFAIGMEAGERHQQDRKFLESVLLPPNQWADLSADKVGELIGSLRHSQTRSFDLVNDYLVHVTWKALASAFGTAADEIIGKSAVEWPEFARDLRNVGGQLISGSGTPKVRKRAEEGAARLNRRVDAALPRLREEQPWACLSDDDAIKRNAVGLLWVAHPATVQAGALVMQELLSRRSVYQQLTSAAREFATPWKDAGFRDCLRRHVLELLRFRPPFPILRREVPRNTWLDIGTQRPIRVRAGSEVAVLIIGALFDDPTHEQEINAYSPRSFHQDDEDRRLVLFGAGERACIAKHHVPEILVSALAGLLTLPNIRWGDPWFHRIDYDGPQISCLRLRFDE